MKTQGEYGYLQTKDRGLKQTHLPQPSGGTNPADTLISEFQLLEMWENEKTNFCYLGPLSRRGQKPWQEKKGKEEGRTDNAIYDNVILLVILKFNP